MTATHLKRIANAARSGNHAAQYELGRILYYGEGIVQSYVRAEHWLRKAAEQGNSQAQYLLGIIHYYGRVGERCNYLEAERWFRPSASQLNPGAEAVLGVMYAQAQGVERDYGESLRWLLRAASHKSVQGIFLLGELYLSGNLGSGDGQDRLAVDYFQNAAEMGHVGAMFKIATLLESSKETLDAAVGWYGKAAERGHAESQFRLAQMYRDGRGIPKDFSQACFWAGKAVENNHHPAMCLLASLYIFEPESENKSDGFRLMLEVADGGNAFAQSLMAIFFFAGEYTDMDEKTASHWLLDAAEGGNSQAQYFLAHEYRAGRLVERSLSLTEHWLRKSAEQGNSSAQVSLGKLLVSGDGGVANDHEAFNWLDMAAGQGNPEAFLLLGLMYSLEIGVARDERKHEQYLRKAAELGNSTAQYLVGLNIVHGSDALIPNSSEAAKWMLKSADSRNENAIRCIRQMLPNEGIALRRPDSSIIPTRHKYPRGYETCH